MIKFSKLSALLLGGALLVAGCATEGDIHKVNERIDQLELGTNTKIENINTQIELLQGVDRELKQAVEVTIPGQISAINNALDLLRAADETLGGRITEEVAKLNKAISDGDAKTAKDAADALKDAIKDLEGKIATAEANAIGAAKGYTDDEIKKLEGNLKAYIDAQDLAITGDNGIINQRVKAAADKLQALIDNITKEGGLLDQNLAAAKAYADAKAKAAQDYADEKDLKNLAAAKEYSDGKLAEAVQGINNKIGDINGTVAGEIARLEGRIERAEEALEALTGEGGTIDKINKQIAALQAFQTANESEVQTFKDFIGASKTTLAQIDEAIENLVQGVGGLQTDVTAIQNQINGEGGILERLTKIDGEDGVIAKIVKAIDDIVKEGGVIDQHINTALAAYYTKEQVEDLIATAKGQILGLEDQEAWLESELKKYIDKTAADAAAGALADANDYTDGVVADALTEAKGYTDGEIKKLQDDVITPLSEKVDALDKQINGEGGIVDQLNQAIEDITEITKEGGLIDQAKAAAIEEANAYTDEQIGILVEAINDAFEWVYEYQQMWADLIFDQIQSVVYVPDYDDKKITINLAHIYSENADEPLETFVEQPTEIVYKVSPERLAETVAALGADIASFDVKTVKTRDDVVEAPSFNIISVKGDNTTGYVTYTVLPKNVASSQFAANRFTPYYHYFHYYTDYLRAVETDENGNPIFYDAEGNVIVWDADRTDDIWSINYDDTDPADYGHINWYFRYPIWRVGEYMQYANRQNFAVALELRKEKMAQDLYGDSYPYDQAVANNDAIIEDILGVPGMGELVTEDKGQYITDISSAYDVLYPAITAEVKLLPDLYEMDEDGNVAKDENGRPILAEPEHQELAYNSEEVKIVLDQSAPAVEIDGEVMSFSEASQKLGLVLPEPTMSDYEYDYSASRNAGNGYFAEGESEDGYATVAMGTNDLSTLAEAVGDVVTVGYTWTTVLGDVYGEGDVTITKARAEVELEGTIRWTYANDADIDHALFVAARAAAAAGEGQGTGDAGSDPTTGDGPTTDPTEPAEPAEPAAFYSRIESNGIELTVVKDDMASIGQKAEDFLVDGSFQPTFNDEEGNPRKAASVKVNGEEVEGLELPFEYISSTYADSKYLLEIQKFAWDTEYKVVCYVENESSLIQVTVTIKTIDRPRDPIQIDLGDVTFIVNKEGAIKLNDELVEGEGLGYNATTGLYYGQSGICYDKIWEGFKAVDEETGKYILAADDFADEMEFAAAEVINVEGEEAKSVSAENPGDIKWLRFANEEGYLHTQKSKKLTPKQLKNIVDVIQEDDEHTDSNLQRNFNTYIGQEIQILWTLKYEVPGYNFLHQLNYTRNAEVPYANRKDVDKLDYAGKKVWFTQASPLYEESRQVLRKYDVSYMNIEEIAFNIVDENDVILTDEEADAANINVNFQYTPVAEQEGLFKCYTDVANQLRYLDNEVALPEIDQRTDEEPFLTKYGDLWDDSRKDELEAHYDHTTFYYRTYEFFIPMRGYMTITSGLKNADTGEFDENSAVFDVETRFTAPKAYVGTASGYGADELLYSNYELVRWTPFTPIDAKTVYLDLDKHEPTAVDILGGISFNDIRPDKGTNVLSFPVLQNGVYVYGDGANGFAEGVYADDAYDIDTKIVFDLSKIDPSLKKNFSQGVRYVLDGEPVTIEELEEQQLATRGEDNDGNPIVTINEEAKARIREIPTLIYDYTSQIEFYDTVEIPVTVTLKTKWMKEHELKTEGYKIIMRGLNAQTDEPAAGEGE